VGAVKLAGIWKRIYGDFFMPSKLDDYKAFLAEFMGHGYEICSISFLWEQIKNNFIKPQSKVHTISDFVPLTFP
jgi:hypothetical protein